jgi:hypothetical protein
LSVRHSGEACPGLKPGAGIQCFFNKIRDWMPDPSSRTPIRDQHDGKNF